MRDEPVDQDERRELEQVIADMREEAGVLRRTRPDDPVATALLRFAGSVATAAADYLTWISEGDAMLRSSHKRAWFRQRRAVWERQGNARRNPHNLREWQYRLLIVPERVHLSQVRADARREAERDEARRSA